MGISYVVDNRSQMRTMVLEYLPTKLRDFGQGHLLVNIQHHGAPGDI
jgi:hypothetical protein